MQWYSVSLWIHLASGANEKYRQEQGRDDKEGRTTDTAKWFVSDIGVHRVYGTLTILAGDPKHSHVIPRLALSGALAISQHPVMGTKFV
jgi:hypothetical protein